MPSAMTGQTTNNNTAPNSPLSPTLSFFPPRHNARKKGEKKHIDLSFLPAYSKQRRARGENFAQRAVAEAIKTLSPSVRSATSATNADEMDNEVEVDRDGEIQLAGINDYAATTSEELWITFNALSNHLRGHNIKIAFFSATPQGGGVALMRHALIRLWRLVGLSVHWYTPEGHPAVFDITKRKFHNILQGVNKPGTKLKEEDKTLFEMWTDNNVDTFWSEGAIDDKSIIVIDDPQLVALIPTIKQRNPNAKIIYRSHIQIDTSLVNDPSKGEGAHADVWNYLFQFIEQADVFLAHPVKAFVPQNVLDSKMPVLYMAPSTDPLDGLNKSIGEADMVYYQHYFGRLSEQQCGVSIDWVRPYVVQVARFDPSKGIPDLLEGYRLFRRKLNKAALSPAEQDTPMLIICGHGSVDDPDGEIIFEEIHETLSSKEYQFIKDDVSVVRVPPCDRTLGAILQGAWCATQLSTKEGFEVKVTEAIHKRVPIIASKAGGIPLQVKDGVNGWLVDPGDSEAVSERLLELYRAKRCPLTSIALLEQDGETPNSMADKTVSDYLARQPKISPTGIKDIGTSEDFWSVGNASKWMLLWSRLAGLEVENEADRNVLGRMLPENGAARSDIWKDMEGRDVWEMISGKKDDTLIIG
nr:trehalose synthase [Phaffia rhodozyma]